MAAGIPGTGIGGLFYLLLGALMPARYGLTRREDRRAGDGRRVGTTLALLAGIVAVLWVQAWAIGRLLASLRHHGVIGDSPALAAVTGPTAGAYLKWAGLVGFASLALVFAIVHGLRLVTRRAALATPSPRGAALAPGAAAVGLAPERSPVATTSPSRGRPRRSARR